MNPSGSLVASMMANPQLAAVLGRLDPGTAGNLANAIASWAGANTQIVPDVSGGPTNSRFKLWNAYYSIVRFQADVDVNAPTTTLTFATQELRPFNYRIGDSAFGGFPQAFGVATEAETNLVKASETVAGEQLLVDGISLMPSSVTDPGLWKVLIANIAVKISMDGDARQYRLGRPDMVPGSGGTFGGGATSTLIPPLESSVSFDTSFSNGWPTIDNYYPFPQPIVWTPSGDTDSNFNIVLKLVRQLVFVQTARASADGIAAFTPPTQVGQYGTFVDFMARMHSSQLAPRSVNS